MPRRDLCQVRRGTAASWTDIDPVLASGEAGYETDTGQLKYGNGTDLWSDLPYFSTGNGSGPVDPDTTLLGNPITTTEFAYLSGTTSNVQTQIDAKMPALFTALPSANLTAVGAQTTMFPAGASITAGQVVRLNNSGKWVQTDADAVATSIGLLSLALQTKNTDESILVALPGSFVRVNSWNWSAGATIYLSTDPGILSESQPMGTDDVIRVVGFAINADVIWFDPSQDYITHI